MAAPTRFVNPNAEVVSKTQALMVNVAAARGLQNVLKTNLGEKEGCATVFVALPEEMRLKDVGARLAAALEYRGGVGAK